MKYTFRVLLVCLLVMTLLAACGKTDPTTTGNKPTTPPPGPTSTQPTTTQPTDPTDPTDPTTPTTGPINPPGPSIPSGHTCRPAFIDYTMDKDYHWQTCECGEVVNRGQHRLEDGVCTVCNAEIFHSEFSNTTFLWMYNEFGHYIMAREYDAGGTLLYTETYAYSYNDYGDILSEKRYTDGVLTEEATWDNWGHLLTTKEYNGNGNLVKSVRYELVCDEYGNILSEKHITDDKFTYEATYSSQHFGLLNETYYLADGTKEHTTYNNYGDPTKRVVYDSKGKAVQTYEFQYQYDSIGIYTQRSCTLNSKPHFEERYNLVTSGADSFTRLSQRTDYLADGSYSVTIYSESGSVIARTCYNANGIPLDNSGRFDSDRCAPLQGVWTGTAALPGDMLGLTGITATLNTTVTVTFDITGNAVVSIDVDADAYRQFAAQMVRQNLLDMYGRDTSAQELDALLKIQYGMSLEQYVQHQVSSMDIESLIHQEWSGVYFVENGMLYLADTWATFAEAYAYTLANGQLGISASDSAGVELGKDNA